MIPCVQIGYWPDSCRWRYGSGLGGFLHLFLLWRFRFRQAADEDVCGCPALHAAALVWAWVFGILADEKDVEVGLHSLDAVVELLAPHDTEVLIEQGPVQPLDETVGLRPPDPGGAMLDLLELEEQLVGVAIGPAAGLAAIVRQHGGDLGSVRLEARQHVIVHQVGRGDQQLVGVEPPPRRSASGNRRRSAARPCRRP